MKNETRTTTILAALSYLIDRQGLKPEQVKKLIINTTKELEKGTD